MLPDVNARYVPRALQKWKLITFQYGRRGKYDPDAATPLLVTDDLHRIRSDLAEDATRRAAAAHPLPAEAANGGRHGADQNTLSETEMIIR